MAEKFTTWDDTYTGINPFYPARDHKPRTLLASIPAYALAFVVFCVKAPFAILFFLCFAASSFASSLIPVPRIRGIARQYTEAPFARLTLAALGFFRIPAYYANPRQVRVRVDRRMMQEMPTAYRKAVRAGDLVVSTHSSFLEVLALCAAVCPVFTAGGDDGMVRVVTPLEAMARSIAADHSPVTAGKPLSDVMSSPAAQEGPVVVFPEGVPTNGRGLLAFLPVLDTVDRMHGLRAHLVGFRFPGKPAFAPVLPAGPAPQFLAWTTAIASHNIEMVMLPAFMVPSVATAKLEQDAAAKSADPTLPAAVAPKAGLKPGQAWSVQMREIMARMLGTKCVGLAAKDADTFRAFYTTGLREDEQAGGQRRARLG